MSINKDKLRELIEDDLFGEGDFSLDDLKKIPDTPPVETIKSKKPNKFLNIELDELSDQLADIQSDLLSLDKLSLLDEKSEKKIKVEIKTEEEETDILLGDLSIKEEVDKDIAINLSLDDDPLSIESNISSLVSSEDDKEELEVDLLGDISIKEKNDNDETISLGMDDDDELSMEDIESNISSLESSEEEEDEDLLGDFSIKEEADKSEKINFGMDDNDQLSLEDIESNISSLESSEDDEEEEEEDLLGDLSIKEEVDKDESISLSLDDDDDLSLEDIESNISLLESSEDDKGEDETISFGLDDDDELGLEDIESNISLLESSEEDKEVDDDLNFDDIDAGIVSLESIGKDDEGLELEEDSLLEVEVEEDLLEDMFSEKKVVINEKKEVKKIPVTEDISNELDVISDPIVPKPMQNTNVFEKNEEIIQKTDDSWLQHDKIDTNEIDDFLYKDKVMQETNIHMSEIDKKTKPFDDDLFKQIDDLSEENKFINVKPIDFPTLDEQISGENFDTNFFANIPVKIDVMLGNTTISLKEVYELTEGSIIELDKLFGEPLELKISGQLVALGEVVAVDDHYGIMLKEIIRNKS